MSSANFPKQVTIGYAGEHNARSIPFDCSEEFEKWPDSSPQVMYVRPTENKDDLVYPGATSVDGNTVYWTPDAFALELEGTTGYCQIFFYSSETSEDDTEAVEEPVGNEEEEETESAEDEMPLYLGKSALVRTTVLPALWAQQSDPILESAEYTSLYKKMQNAAFSIENMTVAADEAEEIGVELSKARGHVHLDFSIPRGRAFEYSDFTPEQLEALRGPQGFIGPAGPQGPQGIQGPKGEDGAISFTDLTEEQQNQLLAGHSWLSNVEIDSIFSSLSLTSAPSN